MKEKKESTYMKEDDKDKEETEKAEGHSEPDADNAGGASDNDEDNKKKVKKESEADEDLEKAEDEEDEEDEDEAKKDAFGGEDPEESAHDATTEGHTTTTKPLIGNRQHVLVPNSNISTGRMGSPGSIAGGQSPSEVHYAGKSAKIDLLKSPLYAGLSKQISGIQKMFETKIEAIEKSVNDRLNNIQKSFNEMMESPLYKALSENVTNDKDEAKSFEKKIDEGKIRYA